MKKHIEEEFVVVEADTIGNPGAVVIHFKHASVALGTVMAPIWLCFVAPLADSYSTIAFAFD